MALAVDDEPHVTPVNGTGARIVVFTRTLRIGNDILMTNRLRDDGVVGNLPTAASAGFFSTSSAFTRRESLPSMPPNLRRHR